MISRMFGAPFGGTTRGAHHGVESFQLSLITPPNFGGGAAAVCLQSLSSRRVPLAAPSPLARTQAKSPASPPKISQPLRKGKTCHSARISSSALSLSNVIGQAMLSPMQRSETLPELSVSCGDSSSGAPTPFLPRSLCPCFLYRTSSLTSPSTSRQESRIPRRMSRITPQCPVLPLCSLPPIPHTGS